MLAAIFPGQGSQKPGMGKSLFDDHVAVRAVFEEISDAAGVNVPGLCFDSDEETLRRTENAQMALYTCGVSAYVALVSEGVRADMFAGHSIGEYSALAAGGWITITEGARLVLKRGELMAASGADRPGTMAAVLGLDRAALEAACKSASTDSEVVVIANDNCPGQMVISGDTAAVSRASTLASEVGAKRVLPLNVSGAFHSPLMEESAIAMGERLRVVTYMVGKAPVYSNVTAGAVTDSGEWAGLLEEQLRSPVRWTETIEAMIAAGATTFVECGVGEVLGGLVRRVSKEVQTAAVYDAESLSAFKGARE